MQLDSYDVVILDCDGVIFDSNLLKVEAFRNALVNYPVKTVEAFSKYFKNNFGISRYHHVKVFIEDFLNQKFDEDLYQSILKNYSDSCKVLYSETNYTDSLLEFLQYYKNKKLYVASGGDEEELNEVFRTKNIHHYFEEILGSPRNKRDLVAEIILQNPKKKILMIGDAKSDFLASQANSIDFIYMNKYSLVNETMRMLSQVNNFKIINHLGDLIDE